MKSSSTSLTLSSLLLSLLLPINSFAEINPNKTILADDMQIYEHPQYGVTTKAVHNSKAKTLPTNNDYKEYPGCYLSCVSNNADYSVYSRGGNENVKGQMRVKGRYVDGHCIPDGYEDKAIRTDVTLKGLCEKNFPKQCVNDSCCVGTEAGDWF